MEYANEPGTPEKSLLRWTRQDVSLHRLDIGAESWRTRMNQLNEKLEEGTDLQGGLEQKGGQ